MSYGQRIAALTHLAEERMGVKQRRSQDEEDAAFTAAKREAANGT